MCTRCSNSTKPWTDPEEKQRGPKRAPGKAAQIQMKKLTVEVCVCTQCVLNGAMHIIESIEGLKKLKRSFA